LNPGPVPAIFKRSATPVQGVCLAQRYGQLAFDDQIPISRLPGMTG
jgi:hypothetical protein